MTDGIRKLGVIAPGQIYYLKKEITTQSGKKSIMEHYFFISDVYMRQIPSMFGMQVDPEIYFSVYDLTAADGEFNLSNSYDRQKISEVSAQDILAHLRNATFYDTVELPTDYDKFTDKVMQTGKRTIILAALANMACALGIFLAKWIVS